LFFLGKKKEVVRKNNMRMSVSAVSAVSALAVSYLSSELTPTLHISRIDDPESGIVQNNQPEITPRHSVNERGFERP
jgi:hypothetical protein